MLLPWIIRIQNTKHCSHSPFIHGFAPMNTTQQELKEPLSLQYNTSIRRHLDRAPAARGQGVVLFYLLTCRLKDRKNGGFRANPLAKCRRYSFFGVLFKLFRKFSYAKIRLVHSYRRFPLVASLFYYRLSALLRTEKDKAREENLREFTNRK